MRLRKWELTIFKTGMVAELIHFIFVTQSNFSKWAFRYPKRLPTSCLEVVSYPYKAKSISLVGNESPKRITN